MNPIALWGNIRHSSRVCMGWQDGLQRILWLYSDKPYLKMFSRPERIIGYRYDAPIGDLRLTVRDNRGSDAFIISEVFDHRYYELNLPSAPKTILDLGANAGFTAIFFARRYPGAALACVEPVPGNIGVLEKNLTRNKIKATLFPAAVAVEDGVLQMQLADRDYGHKVAGLEYGASLTGSTLDVDGLSVPTLMKRLGWDRIGLLKVDIEGYEGILLKERCEWLNCVDAMCIECHENYGEADLRALAERWGFNPPRLLVGTWLLSRKNV